MSRMIRRCLALAVASCSVVALLGGPASAQQLVDAGKEGTGGGLAFVLFGVMVFIIAGALFFMDHVRKRKTADEDAE
jgi:putative Ca2+/H+ antiporter (TMEM165/GDT1 family)